MKRNQWRGTCFVGGMYLVLTILSKGICITERDTEISVVSIADATDIDSNNCRMSGWYPQLVV